MEPDIIDKDLIDYVQVYHRDHHTVYATDEGEPTIPEKYREYKDVFISPPNGQLPEYRLFDFKVNIQEGKQPKYIPIYHLAQKESKTLEEYVKT